MIERRNPNDGASLAEPNATVSVAVSVNGVIRTAVVPARLTVADLLRDRFHLTGTHLGCEHGVCGACTVLLDGAAVRSCLMYAGQIDGRQVVTVEGLGANDGTLHPLQEAFRVASALQCGFCTPGMLLAAFELLQESAAPSEAEIRDALSGNLCRCTGYETIVAAVQRAADRWQR